MTHAPRSGTTPATLVGSATQARAQLRLLRGTAGVGCCSSLCHARSLRMSYQASARSPATHSVCMPVLHQKRHRYTHTHARTGLARRVDHHVLVAPGLATARRSFHGGSHAAQRRVRIYARHMAKAKANPKDTVGMHPYRVGHVSKGNGDYRQGHGGHAPIPCRGLLECLQDLRRWWSTHGACVSNSGMPRRR